MRTPPLGLLLASARSTGLAAIVAFSVLIPVGMSAQSPASDPQFVSLFNGKDLSNWDGDLKLWSVKDGEIVGKSPGIKKNTFLTSHMVATDFKLTIKVKLVPNKENSGVQFRSEALADGEMKGPQADVGLGYWGTLYEESARGKLADNSSQRSLGFTARE